MSQATDKHMARAAEIEQEYRTHVFSLHTAQILEDVRLTELIAEALASVERETSAQKIVWPSEEEFEAAATAYATRLDRELKQTIDMSRKAGVLEGIYWLKARLLGGEK